MQWKRLLEKFHAAEVLNLRILFPMEDFISSFCVLSIGIREVPATV